MASPVQPMLALGAISYANNWYNTKNPLDVKPLLYAGIGALLLSGFGAIPGMNQVAVSVGWLAVAGMFLSPVQSPSPAQNLVSITSGATAKKSNGKTTLT